MSGLTNLPVSLPKEPLPSDTHIPQLEQKFATILNIDTSLEPYLVSDAVWRDSYALTGTLRTFYGNHNISTTWHSINFDTKSHSFKPTSLSKKIQLPGSASWVDIYYEFETAGVPQLQCTIGLSLIYSKLDEHTPEGPWKIWIVKSVLDQIKYAPNVDTLKPSNTLCTENNACLSSLSSQYFDCVIVGGGQAGLSTAGYCQALGLSYIIIEKNREIGDNWAKRYTSARIHTIREYAHLPFERTFGPEYPEFLGKDDLAAAYKSWYRRYNIRVSLSTVLESGSWDPESNQWTLNLRNADESDGEIISLNSAFVVMAVGAGGQVPILPDLPGRVSRPAPVYSISMT